jgi:MFS family permease
MGWVTEQTAVAPAPRTGGRSPGGRLAAAALFTVFGAAQGSWAGRIPWVQDSLDLSAGALGLALLGPAAGALLLMPVVGQLVHRFGVRAVAVTGVLGVGVAVALPAFAPNVWLLLATLVLLGAAGGVLDIAVNAYGVDVERRYGRPIMSGLHGMWSVGGLIGSALAGLVAHAGIPATTHLLVVGGVTAAIGGTVAMRMRATAVPTDRGPTFALPSRSVLLIAMVGFCALFTEAAIGDWGAVFLAEVRDTGPGLAAAAYSAFSICMAVGRLTGDRLVARFGPSGLVRVAATVGVAGLVIAVVVPHPAAALAGFGLLGLGIATVVPLTFSAAGNRGEDGGHGRAASSIAAVATVSYLGWLAGPSVVGGIAQLTTLPIALSVAAGLLAVVALLARSLDSRRG